MNVPSYCKSQAMAFSMHVFENQAKFMVGMALKYPSLGINFKTVLATEPWPGV